MIVNHFSTFPYGGAAAATMRLHHELLRQGISSKFLYHRSDRDPPTDATFQRVDFPPESKRTWMAGLRKMERRRRNRRIYRLFDQHLATRDPGLEVFSMAELPGRTSLDWQRYRADIAHLHWIAFFADYPSFFDSIPADVPVVWTLHDMNPLTGGCHYSGGCTRFESGCGNCPQVVDAAARDVSSSSYRAKRRALRNKNLTVVTPSRWLGNLARRSGIWPAGTRFEVIHYGLDLEAFQAIDKLQARAQLELPKDPVLIGFGAEDTGNLRKGIDLLLPALGKLECERDVACVVIGSGKVPLECPGGPRIEQLGFLDSKTQLAQFYSACDLIVVPSREDNSPQIGLEAMACGTPVVGFDVGGIAEYVIPGRTGQLARAGDVQDLARKISLLVSDAKARAEMSWQARQLMVQEFEIVRQSEKYVALYCDAMRGLNVRNAA